MFKAGRFYKHNVDDTLIYKVTRVVGIVTTFAWNDRNNPDRVTTYIDTRGDLSFPFYYEVDINGNRVEPEVPVVASEPVYVYVAVIRGINGLSSLSHTNEETFLRMCQEHGQTVISKKRIKINL